MNGASASITAANPITAVTANAMLTDVNRYSETGASEVQACQPERIATYAVKRGEIIIPFAEANVIVF